MITINSIAKMRSLRRHITGSVGFVPTMGYLHEGHLSLVREAWTENSIVIVSIFLNPTQFGPGEDYGVYPRDPERDFDLLEKEKTGIVFVHSVEEMYPSGFSSWVEVDRVTERLEGACRPVHFRGVTTVVPKLINIVEPTKAYLGQKDAQQAIVIKKMVTDLSMNLEVVVLPTIRGEDGLVMSSPNIYLDPEKRRAATILFKTLTLAQQLYNEGETDAGRIR
jgi:pantoate--beta-alanine ligase